MGDVIKQISDALERVYRYLLPGACLVIAARLSHPSWFRCVDYGRSQQLLLLAIIAVCAGNIWYIFHRYSVHQFTDLLMYRRYRIKRGTCTNYDQWLIKHISDSFRLPGCSGVELRAAHIIFMCIVCEIVFISACCHEQCSWFGQIGRYDWLIAFVAGGFFICAIWQYYILFNVDIEIVTSPPASAEIIKPPK